MIEIKMVCDACGKSVYIAKPDMRPNGVGWLRNEHEPSSEIPTFITTTDRCPRCVDKFGERIGYHARGDADVMG